MLSVFNRYVRDLVLNLSFSVKDGGKNLKRLKLQFP